MNYGLHSKLVLDISSKVESITSLDQMFWVLWNFSYNFPTVNVIYIKKSSPYAKILHLPYTTI